eukprot:CAMPEP_0185730278 /NCGR_PEP_ID=MMETSP1171-20130828/9237_1 /TAXON_ID=374046 /ORGANISM="Helicotheca tamensis, Strain CCMP826" /LENGTH=361 /DNA_ID=CAMNT_0028399293 /DNA_START=133 /DNA_END=1218 /DNA_ORIENTATION=+
MAEFDALTFTDLLREYGQPLAPQQGEEMFQTATKFALELADDKLEMSGKTYETAGSDLYFSYVVCNSNGDNVSVKARRDELISEIQKAGISSTNVIMSTSYGSSSIDRSCWLVRVPGNAFAEVFGKNPDVADFVEVQPLLPEMKISQQTVDAAQLILAGNKVTDLTDKATDQDFLGLGLVICDGVYQFDGQTVDDGVVTEKLIDFIKNGQMVKDMSFQYYYFTNLEEGSDYYSERMKLWYDSIVETVDNGGTGDNNNCYNAIDTHMIKAPDSELGNFAVTFDTVDSIELGFVSDDERDSCIYYIIHALALHPYVCTVAPTLVNTIDPPPEPTPPTSGMAMTKVGGMSALLLAVATVAVSML